MEKPQAVTIISFEACWVFLISYPIGLCTTKMSKSIQSVHGFGIAQ